MAKFLSNENFLYTVIIITSGLKITAVGSLQLLVHYYIRPQYVSYLTTGVAFAKELLAALCFIHIYTHSKSIQSHKTSVQVNFIHAKET